MNPPKSFAQEVESKTLYDAMRALLKNSLLLCSWFPSSTASLRHFQNHFSVLWNLPIIIAHPQAVTGRFLELQLLWSVALM